MSAVRPKRERPPADWELVLKRNPVERIKQEKAPLGIREELPALIAAGYEQVAEEDIVRLQWWGLYHDKPKVGTFMLRIKLPGGRVTPAQLRRSARSRTATARATASSRPGSASSCTGSSWRSCPTSSTRSTRPACRPPAAVATPSATSPAVRSRASSADEVFDASGIVTEVADFFYGNPDYTNLPRKHKYTISACPHGCNIPEINCVALVGVIHEGREGFAVRVGGGLPRCPGSSASSACSCQRGGHRDPAGLHRRLVGRPNYRVSRVKARLKFMIDDIGADGMRARVEERLGRTLEDYTCPAGRSGWPTTSASTASVRRA